ncbi:NfeD family protein [Massilia niabensis]|uniref:Nodulation protein NfeD n=1 Tax=Massilia niabensis TaxID=544910 RepID=A0ABW0LCX6_9BURK
MFLRSRGSLSFAVTILPAVLLILLALLPRPALGAAGVGLLVVDGAIGPASADYIVRGIARSAQNGDQLVILQMDTPGGLDTSMRSVIKAILTAPLPVATFVAPGGARAASAGTYILYASHIAAMAPGTNLGAATPVEVGIGPQPPQQPSDPVRRPGPGGAEDAKKPRDGADGPLSGSALTRKQVNDAAAYLRSLAQLRGRNADWAERAVREAVSLSANEALQQDVIEYVAADVPDLLAQLDGQAATVLGQEKRLATRGAAVNPFAADWRTNVLGAITNPGVALLLMTIGVYGLLFEFMNPGFVAPGVIGAICLLLGLYALQLLPVNYAGLALIALGLLFMVGEAFLPSFGVLGLGGVVAFIAGALMLIDTELPGYGVPPGLVAGLGLVSFLLVTGTVRLALKTRRRPVTSGAASFIGAEARVEDVAPGGMEAWVRLDGELWKAIGTAPLRRAQAVRVVARSGLVLKVAPIDTQQGAST